MSLTLTRRQLCRVIEYPLPAQGRAGRRATRPGGSRVSAVTELLPVGNSSWDCYPVFCDCPRALVIEPLHEQIRRWPDGRIRFPRPARFTHLKVWHRDACPRSAAALEKAS